MAQPSAANAAASGASVTPGLKVYAFIVKRRDLTDETFHAHWREPHGRLTLKVPQIRRYLQNHGIGAVPTVPGLQPTPYLGIATVWVDSPAELAAIDDDPGFVEVHEDELNLLEREELRWFIGEEIVVMRGPAENDKSARTTKALLILKRPPAVQLDRFAAQLLELAGTCQEFVPDIRAVKCTRLAASAYGPEDEPFCDGILELMFESEPSFQKAWEEASADVLRRVGSIADLQGSRGFLAIEERVLWPPFPALNRTWGVST